jgi:hypothetical protein
MAFYRICPDCGAALDPGEHCNCRTSEIYTHEWNYSMFAGIDNSRYELVAVTDDVDECKGKIKAAEINGLSVIVMTKEGDACYETGSINLLGKMDSGHNRPSTSGATDRGTNQVDLFTIFPELEVPGHGRE